MVVEESGNPRERGQRFVVGVGPAVALCLGPGELFDHVSRRKTSLGGVSTHVETYWTLVERMFLDIPAQRAGLCDRTETVIFR